MVRLIWFTLPVLATCIDNVDHCDAQALLQSQNIVRSTDGQNRANVHKDLAGTPDDSVIDTSVEENGLNDDSVTDTSVEDGLNVTTTTAVPEPVPYEVESGGVSVQILGNSGKIRMFSAEVGHNDPNAIVIEMDSLQELDVNGNPVGTSGQDRHSINTFANQDFTFHPVVYDHMMGVNSLLTANKLSFTSPVGNVGYISVDTFIMRSRGHVGPQGEEWGVRAGDMKFNVNFPSWTFCDACGNRGTEVGAFLELKIKIKGAAASVTLVEGTTNTYTLGGNANLTLTDKVMLDGVQGVMAEGFPQLSMQGNSQIFSFRFPRFESSAEYDPVLSQDWVEETLCENWYHLIAAYDSDHAPVNGQFFGAESHVDNSGSLTFLPADDGSGLQKWCLEPNDHGMYTITEMSSGRLLEVQGSTIRLVDGSSRDSEEQASHQDSKWLVEFNGWMEPGLVRPAFGLGYMCIDNQSRLRPCAAEERIGDLKFFMRPRGFAVLHTEGACPSLYLIHPVDSPVAGQSSETVEGCAAICQEELTCGYFAFVPSTEHNTCMLYTECPATAYQAPSGSIFTAYEMLGPGSENEVRHEEETLADRYARELADHQEFMCSQHRDTSGTCRWFGCWAWRGDTECVDARCECAPGGCSVDGVCVSAADFHEHWCSQQTGLVQFCEIHGIQTTWLRRDAPP